MALVSTSYNSDDVLFLLQDLSDIMTPLSASERAKAMENGTHYSEMLPKEEKPSEVYFNLYQSSLSRHESDIAHYIAYLATLIKNRCNGRVPILVSLARAGTPVGILIKRYLSKIYHIECNHYSISIIRDKGLDVNALEYIYHHEILTLNHEVSDIIFIDGWTGKGAIKTELERSVSSLKIQDTKWNDLSDDLYVLADPGCVTPYCATRKDWLLPSACLNSTVSGLISCSILNKHINVEAGDFHGAVYFSDFESIDQSCAFVDRITALFSSIQEEPRPFAIEPEHSGMMIVNNVCEQFGVQDYLKVKPGVGETTRVLLRRIPYKVLLDFRVSLDDPDIAHIIQLCNDKHVTIETFNLGNYKVCGIIKEHADI